MNFLKNIPSEASDADLVSAYKSTGNVELLSVLYQRYMDLTYGVCLKYFKNADDSKDAVMNIFEELVVKLRKYDVENFKGWLFQVARNFCLMKIRKDKSKPYAVDADLVQLEQESHLDEVMEKEVHLNSMHDCIKQLVKEQKEMITLFYLKEICYKEIAETTGVNISLVRSYIQNGRRNLKICMEKQSNSLS